AVAWRRPYAIRPVMRKLPPSQGTKQAACRAQNSPSAAQRDHCETEERSGLELHRHCACFETRPLGAPQHEELLLGIKKNLILRSPRSGQLEGLTGSIRPIVVSQQSCIAGESLSRMNDRVNSRSGRAW